MNMEKFQKNLTHHTLYKSIEDSIQKMQSFNVSRSDLKIIASAIRELQYTFRIFLRYQGKRKVTVFGSARCEKNNPNYREAKRFAKEIVQQGYMVLTGAGGGIMHAAQEGAGPQKSFGLNIRLPFEQRPNPIIRGDSKLINFKYFFTRKLTMVKESDALVLFPGGFGTQDELFETLTLLQTGKSAPKPVVCLESKGGTYWKEWKKMNLHMFYNRGLISKNDFNLVHTTDSTEDAISHITRFYENYHSLRFHERWLLIRIHRLPPEDVLKNLSREFKDILISKSISTVTSHSSYDLKEEWHHLKTIRLHFNQKDFGRLRAFINRLNEY